MNSQLNKLEKVYIQTIKDQPCIVCDTPPPSDAHHIEQGLHFLCVPLCKSCHQDNKNGIHGEKRMWKITKKTEMSVLNDVIRIMMCEMG